VPGTNPALLGLTETDLSCRALTHLWVEGQSIRALPTLPPQLQHLDVSGCKIRLLPALPATLQTLCCVNCAELTALPSSLSSTAVTELDCNGCVSLRRLPQLPESLGVLRAERCKALTEVTEH
jgi:Leucine-rich repeat (LRR) protein